MFDAHDQIPLRKYSKDCKLSAGFYPRSAGNSLSQTYKITVRPKNLNLNPAMFLILALIAFGPARPTMLI